MGDSGFQNFGFPIDFHIDPQLARASTLPAACYFGDAFFAAEKRAVFRRTWQPAGRTEQAAAPGDFFTVELAGQPLVVVRGADGELRAFHNVCRHRASVVAEGCGHAKVFRCPYHGWTYGLDGKLAGCREFEGVERFDRDATGLAPVRVATWGPFVFVHLGDGEPTLTDVLADIPSDVRRFGVDLDRYRFLGRRDYVVGCNWKVYVDNYLEGYHIPLVHPQLHRELDYSRYRVDTFRYYSSQYGPLRDKPGADGKRRYDPLTGSREALYYWLFPNFMVNIYPDNLSSNLILPLGPDRTLTIFEWFVPESAAAATAANMADVMQFSDQVQQEDIRICERVQKGLQSGSYERGRYSVKRENGVHHFHRLLEEFLRR